MMDKSLEYIKKINNTEKTYLSDSDTILDFFCNKVIINEDNHLLQFFY